MNTKTHNNDVVFVIVTIEKLVCREMLHFEFSRFLGEISIRKIPVEGNFLLFAGLDV